MDAFQGWRRGFDWAIFRQAGYALSFFAELVLLLKHDLWPPAPKVVVKNALEAVRPIKRRLLCSRPGYSGEPREFGQCTQDSVQGVSVSYPKYLCTYGERILDILTGWRWPMKLLTVPRAPVTPTCLGQSLWGNLPYTREREQPLNAQRAKHWCPCAIFLCRLVANQCSPRQEDFDGGCSIPGVKGICINNINLGQTSSVCITYGTAQSSNSEVSIKC